MIRALRGTKDTLPDESRLWQEAELAMRRILAAYGYGEIRTPIIEETALFVKSIGETTDIVSKEMFSFRDRGDRDITLRPEGTAAVIRAYIEHHLDQASPLQKLCYVGPMFRAERPQAGRMRQFHQVGVEAIGSSGPAIDAETMVLALDLLDSVGVEGTTLRVNNLGCAEDKKRLAAALKEALASDRSILCEDCARRLEKNALRILDCKNEKCRGVVRKKFAAIEYVCDGCRDHFSGVLGFLDGMGVPYVRDPYIVRGLDYYTKTVFELTNPSLGAQDAVGAGGRYDTLVRAMGGPDVGACGFALGIERMMMARKTPAGKPGEGGRVLCYVACVSGKAVTSAFDLARKLRKAGISCDMDFDGRSLKAQMRSADKLGAKFAIIIGDDELARGEALVRDMAAQEQASLPWASVVDHVKAKAG